MLKIRVVKSKTYACNDEAKRPPRQVPMDTSTSPRRLCRLHDMPDGEAMALDIALPEGEESVILLRLGEHVNAWLNICPHAGRRLDWAPGKFLVSKGMLVCAAHGASFNVQNGECIGGPCRGESLRAVPVRVEQGDVVLDL
jgi:nitrite reductase/ring-hydroxylating ferredoxin subunit